MTDNTLPEVGSRWTINNEPAEVSATKKRGRGYQVVVQTSGDEGPMTGIYRLADFRKQAKPA